MIKTDTKLGERLLRIYQDLKRFDEGLPISMRARPSERKILRHLVPSNAQSILDVGASLGSTAVLFHKLFPAATIHAFEPDPAVFRALERRASRLEGVRAHNLGISDRQGSRILYRASLSSANSFHRLDPEGAKAGGSVAIEPLGEAEVAVTTLDAFCRDHGITSVDFLKLDVQGHEPACLAGARELLSRQAIKAMKVEVMPHRFYDRATTLLEFEKTLEPLGYVLWTLTQLHYGPNGETLYFDAFFVPGRRG